MSAASIIPIAMPKWGIEMTEGKILGWTKAVGDVIAGGDVVLEIESEKVVNAWESSGTGVLRRQLVSEGDSLTVGALLGVIADAAVADADIDAFVRGYDTKAADAPKAASSVSPPPPPDVQEPASISPVIRRLAEQLGVDLSTVKGTGRDARILRQDVEQAAQVPAVAMAAGVPLSATRKTIAARLTEAKRTIPHYYLKADLVVDRLLERRRALQVSVNDLLIWCVSRALVAEPRVNLRFVDDRVQQFARANIAIAVATDEGLVTPVLPAADRLTPEAISQQAAALIDKARRGRLARDDIADGTFTLSNLGMHGVDEFSAIINPPQAAILAAGAIRERVVVESGQMVARHVMTATLSCDHRVIDGAVGGSFLQALRAAIASA